MQRGFRNRVLFFGVLLVVAIVLPLALKSSLSGGEKLKVGVARVPSFGLVYLAHALGSFAEENLDVTLERYPLGRDALEGLVAGKVDVATAFQTPFVHQIRAGRDLSIISSLNRSIRGAGIIAREGIRKPADLVGKLIAYTPDTTSQTFLMVFLRAQGIATKRVRFIKLLPSEFKEKWISGAIDAVSTWEPELSRLEALLPQGKSTRFYSELFTELSLVITERKTVSTRASALRKLLRGLWNAQQFVLDEPESAFMLLCQEFKELDPKVVRATEQAYSSLMNLDHVLLLALEQEAEFSDMASLNIARLIFPRYLEEISQDAVTIFRRRARMGEETR